MLADEVSYESRCQQSESGAGRVEDEDAEHRDARILPENQGVMAQRLCNIQYIYSWATREMVQSVFAQTAGRE